MQLRGGKSLLRVWDRPRVLAGEKKRMDPSTFLFKEGSGMIPGSWDGAPYRALCSAGSLLLPLPLLAVPPACARARTLSLSSNK